MSKYQDDCNKLIGTLKQVALVIGELNNVVNYIDVRASSYGLDKYEGELMTKKVIKCIDEINTLYKISNRMHDVIDEVVVDITEDVIKDGTRYGQNSSAYNNGTQQEEL